jgi:uncharacterized protein (TIGR02594 family)
MKVTAYQLAERCLGLTEIPGVADNPRVLAMLQLDQSWPEHDEVPWCSAFLNEICWWLRLPRSKSLLARSWLAVGQPIELEAAEVGFDVVVLQRGGGDQPGPENTTAPGHAGFYAGRDGNQILVLGGNQANTVSVESYPTARLLGVRRLHASAC